MKQNQLTRMVNGCEQCKLHSQNDHVTHDQCAESLCAHEADTYPHRKKRLRLPYGCLSRINFMSYAWYWSSSSNANNSNRAWNINFNHGNDNWNNKNNRFYVRLVRSGE